MPSRKNRGNGEGSIYKRKSDGRWVGSLTVGYVVRDGRRRRTTKTIYGTTRTEVAEKLASLQHGKATHTLAQSGGISVEGYLQHWLSVAKSKVRPSTYVSYEGVTRLHLTPRIGSGRLDALSPQRVQGMYATMQADGLSTRQITKSHAVLRRALNMALKQGMIVRNPCDACEVPAYKSPEMRTLSAKQASQLLKAAESTRFHALIVLAITTGLRQGELFGLHWSDVDLDAQTLTVRRALIELAGRHSYGPPKSKNGARTISLPQIAVDAVKAHRAQMLREGFVGQSLLFVDTKGGPLRKSNFTRGVFKKLLKAAGCPEIRFHDLRHTSATLMLASGVHPKVAQQRLGHSQISVTLDTYSHVLPEMDQAAAATFDRLGTATA